MIAIATGYDMLDKKLKDLLEDAKIVNYREFLTKKPFDIVVLSRHLIGNIKLEELILLLRQNNTRVIFLTEEDDVKDIRLCLKYAIYDIIFDPIVPEKIMNVIENPNNFADIKNIFLKVNSGDPTSSDLDISDILEKEKQDFEVKQRNFKKKQKELEERQKQIEQMAKKSDKQQKEKAEKLRQALEEELIKKQEELKERKKEIEEMKKEAIISQKEREKRMRMVLEQEMKNKEKELEEKKKHLEELESKASVGEKEREKQIREALKKEMKDREKELEKKKLELENVLQNKKEQEEKIRKQLEKQMREEMEKEKKDLEERRKKISELEAQTQTKLKKELEEKMKEKRKELEEKKRMLEEKEKQFNEIKQEKVINKITNETVYQTPSDFNKVIAIISPETTGKTTMAVNLATQFANINLDTVLIDTDLVNKDIYYNFNDEYTGCLSKIGSHEKVLEYGRKINEKLTVFSEHKDVEVKFGKYDLVKLITAAKKHKQVVILDIGKSLDDYNTKDILEVADIPMIVVDQKITTLNRLPQKLYPYKDFLDGSHIIINKYEEVKYLDEKGIKNFFNEIPIDKYSNFSIEIDKVHTVCEDNKSAIEGLMSRTPTINVEENKIKDDIEKIVNSFYIQKPEESSLKKIFEFLGLAKKNND